MPVFVKLFPVFCFARCIIKKYKKGLTNKSKDCIVSISNQYENKEIKIVIKRGFAIRFAVETGDLLDSIKNQIRR